MNFEIKFQFEFQFKTLKQIFPSKSTEKNCAQVKMRKCRDSLDGEPFASLQKKKPGQIPPEFAPIKLKMSGVFTNHPLRASFLQDIALSQCGVVCFL